jgi:hypothetical protein
MRIFRRIRSLNAATSARFIWIVTNYLRYLVRGFRVQALDDALLIDNDEEILMADDEANEQVPSSEYLVIDIVGAISQFRTFADMGISHWRKSSA